MAALIPHARAAREEAGRLRDEAMTLKRAMRESAAHSREQRLTAEEAMSRAVARRDEPLPSPWSALHWTHNADTLAGVLVPIS
ncbi:MAG TPA: hypothetical protein VFM43_06815 [Gaiellaceae bacterium]|nr:hypothetical protein [Gaiellaceae bacterium]